MTIKRMQLNSLKSPRCSIFRFSVFHASPYMTLKKHRSEQELKQIYKESYKNLCINYMTLKKTSF
jgi:hypothetical protein